MRRALSVLFAIVSLSVIPGLTVGVGIVLLPSASVAQDTADLLLTNGKIVTVDDRFTIAQALAIKGQRIVAVGSTAEIDKLKGPPPRVIDPASPTALPA